MPILPRLVSLYEKRGIGIATGLNPSHFGGFPLAPYTWFLRGGESLTNGLGIALQEVYFLECLFARYRPRTLFVIGNSLGWSTLAVALAVPEGRVLAIDAGFDRHSRHGIDFTNRVAAEENLAVRAVEGKSPEDVARVVAAEQLPPIEFAFVDGYHSVEQVPRDFAAIRAHAAPGCVYLFHDVVTFNLAAAVERVAREHALEYRLLPGTTSGMALIYDPGFLLALDDIAPFLGSPESEAVIRRAAWNHRHRHLARWRRSLDKRRGRYRPPAFLDDAT